MWHRMSAKITYGVEENRCLGMRLCGHCGKKIGVEKGNGGSDRRSDEVGVTMS